MTALLQLIALVCPKCGAAGESTRRGAHMPCVKCALESRGETIVNMVPAKASELARVEPEEKEEPPAVVLLGQIDTRKYQRDCEKDGHVFSGECCGQCGKPTPDDPPSGKYNNEAGQLVAGFWDKETRLLTLAAVLFLLALFNASGCASLRARPDEMPEQPTLADAVLLGGAVALIGLDVAQSIHADDYRVDTRGWKYLPKDTHLFHETDPLVAAFTGPYPTAVQTVGFGLLGASLTVAGWALLPPRWRLIVPGAIVAGESLNVASMVRAGISIPIP